MKKSHLMGFMFAVSIMTAQPVNAAEIFYDEAIWVHQLNASWSLNDLPANSPTEFNCNTAQPFPDTGQCEFELTTTSRSMALAATFASYPTSSMYFDGSSMQIGTSGSLSASSSINTSELLPGESIEIFAQSEFEGIIRDNTFDTLHVVGDVSTNWFDFSIYDITLNAQIFEATSGNIHWVQEDVFTLPVVRGHDYRVTAKACTRTYEQTGPFDNCDYDSGLGEASSSVAWTIAGQAAIPIPASLWLFGSGLLGFIGILKKHKSV